MEHAVVYGCMSAAALTHFILANGPPRSYLVVPRRADKQDPVERSGGLSPSSWQCTIRLDLPWQERPLGWSAGAGQLPAASRARAQRAL